MPDVYIRVGRAGPKVFGNPSNSQSIVFVDAPPHADIAALLGWQGSYGMFHSVGSLIARFDGEPEELTDIARRLRVKGPVGRISQAPSAASEIEWLAEKDEDPTIIARCRAVELRALLDWGRAMWKPATYHYRLPSGMHVSSFVKLGNAMRAPRDADVLATWLDASVYDNTGLIIDSPTLSPLVLATQKRVLQTGLELGPVAMLEDYPRTQYDVTSAVQRVAAASDGRVTAVLSVNSSGRLRDLIIQALNAQGNLLEDWQLHVLVSSELSLPEERVVQWLPLPGEDPLIEKGGTNDLSCRLCASNSKAAVISIDPQTFDGVLPTQIRKMMPSWRDASDNRDFWEMCRRSEALEAEEAPHEAVADFRPRRFRFAVRLHWERILTHPENHGAIGLKLKQRLLQAGLDLDADCVLVPQGEAELSIPIENPPFAQEGVYDAFFQTIKGEICSAQRYFSFPIKDRWPDDVADAVRAAKRILILSLGTVTGSSLQRGLKGVQTARSDSDYEVQGLVVHARPEKESDWQALVNSFEKRLTCAWLSFVPLSYSPLRNELELLRNLDPARLSERARQFHERRQLLCTGATDVRSEPLFWGSSLDSELTAHALPGDLDAIGTYLAVAAQLQRRRVQEPVTVPERRVFDLEKIFVSYFDDLILAAVLRWVRPYEAGWGLHEGDAARVLVQALGSATTEQRRILVPELLLATAEGKVPSKEIEIVITHAERLLATAEDDLAGALELGLFLVS